MSGNSEDEALAEQVAAKFSEAPDRQRDNARQLFLLGKWLNETGAAAVPGYPKWELALARVIYAKYSSVDDAAESISSMKPQELRDMLGPKVADEMRVLVEEIKTRSELVYAWGSKPEQQVEESKTPTTQPQDKALLDKLQSRVDTIGEFRKAMERLNSALVENLEIRRSRVPEDEAVEVVKSADAHQQTQPQARHEITVVDEYLAPAGGWTAKEKEMLRGILEGIRAGGGWHVGIAEWEWRRLSPEKKRYYVQQALEVYEKYRKDHIAGRISDEEAVRLAHPDVELIKWFKRRGLVDGFLIGLFGTGVVMKLLEKK